MNMAEASQSRSELFMRIDQNLDDEESEDLRNYVASKRLLPGRGLNTMKPHKVFMKLEQRGKLKLGDLSLLEDMMRKLGREDFVEEAQQIAEEERKASCSHSERAPDTEEQSATSASSDERDNIYFKFVERSEKIFHEKVLEDPDKFSLAVETFKQHADTVFGIIESDTDDSDIQMISRKAKLTVKRKVKTETIRVDDKLFTDQILSDLSKYNLLVHCFMRFSAILKRATRGCVLCHLDFVDDSCFKSFMQAYRDGSLSETLTQELITGDMRAEEGEDLWVHVSLLDGDEEDKNCSTSDEAAGKVPSVDTEQEMSHNIETRGRILRKDTHQKPIEVEGKWKEEREARAASKWTDTSEWLQRRMEAEKVKEEAMRQAGEAAKRRAAEAEARIHFEAMKAREEAMRRAAEAEPIKAREEAMGRAAEAERQAQMMQAERRRRRKRKFLGIF